MPATRKNVPDRHENIGLKQILHNKSQYINDITCENYSQKPYCQIKKECIFAKLKRKYHHRKNSKTLKIKSS